jgi:hypothetical protein
MRHCGNSIASAPFATLRSARGAALLRMTAAASTLAIASVATVDNDAARWGLFRGPRCVVGECLGSFACPGCGLVRSVASLLHGEVERAFWFHPGGIAVALLLMFSFAFDACSIARPSLQSWASRSRRRALRIAMVAVLLGYVVRLSAPVAFLPLQP